jgi:hypothetical protein
MGGLYLRGERRERREQRVVYQVIRDQGIENREDRASIRTFFVSTFSGQVHLGNQAIRD